MLTERKSRILKIIANGYISTVVPVASSAIARAEGIEVSPATVRNEMVELEEEGYIHRPHISAGGIPSDKGYRQFVEWLDHTSGLQEDDVSRVRRTAHKPNLATSLNGRQYVDTLETHMLLSSSHDLRSLRLSILSELFRCH